jgi:hypothetical protein
MAHTNFDQLALLLNLLDDPRFDFYVHIDKKALDVPWERLRQAVSLSSLEFITRLDVVWGHPKQITCELNLIRAAMSSTKKYSYLHLISGQDLPLASNNRIFDFFESNLGKQFVDVEHSDVNDSFVYADLIKYRVYRLFGNHGRQQPWQRIGNLASRLQMKLGVNRDRGCLLKHGKGSNWFSITDTFADYVLHNTQVIESHFMHATICCDEFFLQTLLLNSPYSKNIFACPTQPNLPPTMRFVDWNRGRPYTFRENDFQELIHSGCLFARKFDMKVDRKIIYKLKAYIESL